MSTETQTPCPCEAFADAHRFGFIVKLGDSFALADLQSGRSLMYGPKVAHCPFCGALLGRSAELPQAKVR